MHAQNLAAVQRMTFKGAMPDKSLGSALEHVQRVPIVGRTVMPFLKTSYHVGARQVDRTPFGAIGTVIDAARGRYAGGAIPKGLSPLDERVADAVIGSIATAAMTFKALDGEISGAGPSDPKELSRLQAEGWQPYSVRIGNTWHDYRQWGPAVGPLVTAAGIAESAKYGQGDPQKTVGEAVSRMGKYVTDVSVLQSIGQVWQAMNAPDRRGENYVAGLITGNVPLGGLLSSVAGAVDPYERTSKDGDFVTTAAQQVQRRLPGQSFLGVPGREALPVKMDQQGNPVPSQGLNLFRQSQARTSDSQTPDPIVQAFRSAGRAYPEGAKSITYGGVTLPLTSEEQALYRRAQTEAWRDYAADLQGRSWEALDQTGKQRLLSTFARYVNQRARAAVLDASNGKDLDQRADAVRGKGR
jgi:hypothetical protein